MRTRPLLMIGVVAWAGAGCHEGPKHIDPLIDRSAPALVEGKLSSLLGAQIIRPLLQRESGPGGKDVAAVPVLSDGSFSFRAPAHPFWLVAQIDNHVPIRREVRPTPGGKYRIDLVHAPGVKMSGVVVDSFGLRVPGARVTSTGRDLLTWSKPYTESVISRSDGTFTLEKVPLGTAEICATRREDPGVLPGQLQVTCLVQAVSLSGSMDGLLLRLGEPPPWWNADEDNRNLTPHPSWGRRVRVLDQDAKPQADLQAQVWTYDDGFIPLRRGMTLSNVDIDEEGYFWLPNSEKSPAMVNILRRGQRLRWERPRYVEDPSAPWEITQTAPTNLLKVEACDGFITGELTQPTGSPVLLSLAEYSAPSAPAVAWTLSRSDGSFEFENVCLTSYAVHGLDLETLQSAWAGPVQSGNQVRLEMRALRKVRASLEVEAAPKTELNSMPKAKNDAAEPRAGTVPKQPWIRLRLTQGIGLGAGDFVGEGHAPDRAPICLELWEGPHYARAQRVVQTGNQWIEPSRPLATLSGTLDDIGGSPQVNVILAPEYVPGAIRPENCDLGETISSPVQTDGTFSFSRVPEGQYQLSVLRDGRLLTIEQTGPGGLVGAHAAFPVTVQRGQVPDLDGLRVRRVSQ